MVLQYSPDGHMLYVRFRRGQAAETAEVMPEIYVDLDADGRPLGVEFLNADDFFPFLGQGLEGMHATVEVPRSLEAQLERMLAERESAEREPGARVIDRIPMRAEVDEPSAPALSRR